MIWAPTSRSARPRFTVDGSPAGDEVVRTGGASSTFCAARGTHTIAVTGDTRTCACSAISPAAASLSLRKSTSSGGCADPQQGRGATTLNAIIKRRRRGARRRSARIVIAGEAARPKGWSRAAHHRGSAIRAAPTHSAIGFSAVEEAARARLVAGTLARSGAGDNTIELVSTGASRSGPLLPPR